MYLEVCNTILSKLLLGTSLCNKGYSIYVHNKIMFF